MQAGGNGGITPVAVEMVQWALYEPAVFATKGEAEIFIAQKFNELGWSNTYISERNGLWYIFYKKKPTNETQYHKELEIARKLISNRS